MTGHGAEQTNLLALNAAIVAAQAGEHGKGFAVVPKIMKAEESIKGVADQQKRSMGELERAIEGLAKEAEVLRDEVGSPGATRCSGTW